MILEKTKNQIFRKIKKPFPKSPQSLSGVLKKRL